MDAKVSSCKNIIVTLISVHTQIFNRSSVLIELLLMILTDALNVPTQSILDYQLTVTISLSMLKAVIYMQIHLNSFANVIDYCATTVIFVGVIFDIKNR
jgi:hypothetical protein